MATTGQIPDLYSRHLKLPKSPLVRMMIALRGGGLVPVGGRGGGRAAAIFEPAHYVSLQLGFAGDQPSDAADAVRALRPLIYHPVERRAVPVLPGTLGEVLEAIISGSSNAITRGGNSLHPFPELTLCLNPLRATVGWANLTSGNYEPDRYGTPFGVPHFSAPSVVIRETNIAAEMLWLASSLWLATPNEHSPFERSPP